MRYKQLFRIVLLCAVYLVWCGHDYWFSSSALRLRPGDILNLRLLVGDDLVPEAERPLAKQKTPVFRLHARTSTLDLLAAAADSATPVLTHKVTAAGPILVEMSRNFSYISLSDSAFTKYLEHESLAHVTALRDKVGKRAQEKERYARNLKCLAQVGAPAATDSLHARIVGQRLEIVLRQNPYLLKPGAKLTAQLLYKGKPLANHPLFALHCGGPTDFTEIVQHTDARGEAVFTMLKPGLWVVRTVHLFPCNGCDDADWESQWSAYSFELPPAQ
jgi:uncharacterized GH25 family protein